MAAAPAFRTAIVICNPAARHAIAREAIEAASRPLAARGWRVAVVEATSAEETTAQAAEYALAGVDVLLACGGDGTLMRVVNGVLSVTDASCAVGVLPAGTANVWAHETRVPIDIVSALGLLERGARRRVDLGLARIGEDGTPLRFLLSCGAGLDGAVVRAVEGHARWKRYAGRYAYGWPGVIAGTLWSPTAARITVDDAEATHGRLLLALTMNTRRYGGVAPIAQGATVDDGLLDLALFEDPEGDRVAAIPQRLAMTYAALRGHLEQRTPEGVTYRRASRIVIEPQRSFPVQADGDAIGACGPGVPLSIEVERHAVTMIVGAGANPLFGVNED